MQDLRRQCIGLLLAAVLLEACGGGGGGGTSQSTSSAPPTYTVGGVLTGVSGSGLTLQLNGAADLTVAANGSFVFTSSLSSGTAYTVTIKAQPTSPPQTCALSNATGSIAGANVTNVSVTCTDNSYVVGGTVTGLQGSGLVLQNNAGDDLPITNTGQFQFASRILTGATYAVTVKAQPVSPSQTCVVTNGTGAVAAQDIGNVAVDCTTNTYTTGGNVTGLAGSGLVLQLNGAGSLPVAANGSFTFPGSLASGASYAVTVIGQPTSPFQTCVAASSSGAVGNGPVTTVSITCTTNNYSVGGTVTGLTGSGLVLQVNGGQNLAISANGGFEFPVPLASGSAYTVTVKDQTTTFRELCVATNSSGVVGGANISTVSIDCNVVLGFAYVQAPNQEIRGYGIVPVTGALMPLSTHVSIGASPRALVASPGGTTLYSADVQANTIAAFAVDSSKGTLSPVGTPVSLAPSSGASEIAITPSGKFLYAGTYAGDVVRFAIDPVTGGLTSQGIPVHVPGSNWLIPAVTPDGKFLYVLALFGTSTASTLNPYTIDSNTGALTAGSTVTLPSAMDGALQIDPLGRFLYVGSSVHLLSGENETTVHPYSIDSGTGAVTAVGTGTSVTNNNDGGFGIDPSGKYAYLLDTYNSPSLDNHIDQLSIDQSTGALTSVGSPVAVHAAPGNVVCDPSGKFVFVGGAAAANIAPTATWYDVSGYTIGASGPTPGLLSPAGLGMGRTGAPYGHGYVVVVE